MPPSDDTMESPLDLFCLSSFPQTLVEPIPDVYDPASSSPSAFDVSSTVEALVDAFLDGMLAVAEEPLASGPTFEDFENIGYRLLDDWEIVAQKTAEATSPVDIKQNTVIPEAESLVNSVALERCNYPTSPPDGPPADSPTTASLVSDPQCFLDENPVECSTAHNEVVFEISSPVESSKCDAWMVEKSDATVDRDGWLVHPAVSFSFQVEGARGSSTVCRYVFSPVVSSLLFTP